MSKEAPDIQPQTDGRTEARDVSEEGRRREPSRRREPLSTLNTAELHLGRKPLLWHPLTRGEEKLECRDTGPACEC